MAEIHTEVGLQGAVLLDETAILDAITKYNPKILRQFAAAGLRVFLHGLAGFRYQVVEAPKQEPQHKLPGTYLEALKALVVAEEEEILFRAHRAAPRQKSKCCQNGNT